MGGCWLSAVRICERASTAPMVNRATGEAASASRPTVLFSGAGSSSWMEDAKPPSRMAQGMGLVSMPRRAFFSATAMPCLSAPSRRESAMHSEVVITMSTSMPTMMGAAACAPSRATSSGTPMKPVLGKAATSAPKEASFQRMRWFSVTAMVKPTMTSAHSSQTVNTE